MTPRNHGFTIVELMITVAIIGMLSGVAVPSFAKYVKRTKTTEAVMNIRRIFDNSITYYFSDHVTSAGDILTAQFPAGESGPGPDFSTQFTPPIGSCCVGGATSGRPQKCDPAKDNWNAKPAWSALEFRVDDPHWFSYISGWDGDGKSVGAGHYASAGADLDCDGNFSVYWRLATIRSDGGITGKPLAVMNELE